MPDLSRIEVVSDEMAEVLRRMTPQERLAVANRIWVTARKAVEHIVRSENPDWTEEQVRREILRRMLPGTDCGP
jgi:hypothetical protein